MEKKVYSKRVKGPLFKNGEEVGYYMSISDYYPDPGYEVFLRTYNIWLLKTGVCRKVYEWDADRWGADQVTPGHINPEKYKEVCRAMEEFDIVNTLELISWEKPIEYWDDRYLELEKIFADVNPENLEVEGDDLADAGLVKLSIIPADGERHDSVGNDEEGDDLPF